MTRLDRNMEMMHASQARSGKEANGERGGGGGVRQRKLPWHACDVKLMLGSRADRRNTRAAPAHVTTFKKQRRHAQNERPLFLYLSVVFYKNYPRVVSILPDAQIILLTTINSNFRINYVRQKSRTFGF